MTEYQEKRLDLIFKVLVLIAKIMIYRLPVRDSIEEAHVDDFKNELKELQEWQMKSKK